MLTIHEHSDFSKLRRNDCLKQNLGLVTKLFPENPLNHDISTIYFYMAKAFPCHAFTCKGRIGDRGIGAVEGTKETPQALRDCLVGL